MQALTTDQREQFWEEGFLVLPDVVSAKRLRLLRAGVDWAMEEREQYRAEHAELVCEMEEAEGRGEVIHATEWTHVVMQMYQLWERYPPMRDHSLDRELAEVARQALGVETLRLWFDQAMVKPPGDAGTPFHTDNALTPIDTSLGGLITIWTPLTSVTAEMGCLRYVPGSHRGPRLPFIPRLRELDDICELMEDPEALDRAVPAEVPEGGVVMHHGDVIHGARPNVTDRPRPAVLLFYFPDGSRRSAPAGQYVIDRDGVAVGAALAGPGLPIVAGRSD